MLEELWKYRKAAAHNTHSNLDPGPHGDVEDVVRHVWRTREIDGINEANDRRNAGTSDHGEVSSNRERYMENLQETNSKYRRDARLLSYRHLEVPDSAQRKNEDGKVRDDIENSRRDQIGIDVETVTFRYKAIPDLLSRAAGEYFHESVNEI